MAGLQPSQPHEQQVLSGSAHAMPGCAAPVKNSVGRFLFPYSAKRPTVVCRGQFYRLANGHCWWSTARKRVSWDPSSGVVPRMLNPSHTVSQVWLWLGLQVLGCKMLGLSEEGDLHFVRTEGYGHLWPGLEGERRAFQVKKTDPGV